MQPSPPRPGEPAWLACLRNSQLLESFLEWLQSRQAAALLEMEAAVSKGSVEGAQRALGKRQGLAELARYARVAGIGTEESEETPPGGSGDRAG